MCMCSRESCVKKDYDEMSSRELCKKLGKVLKKKSRGGCYTGMYVITAIGSLVASVITPIAGVSCIPASVVSTAAAIDALDELVYLKKKEGLIMGILRERGININFLEKS